MEKRFELHLTAMAHGGDALGRWEGKVVFAPYTIPSEEALVEVVEDKGSYARAQLVEILSPSPDRVVPPCPHFGPGKCGGCQWQHITYEAQLAFKREIVRDQLARIARLPEVPVKTTLGMRDPWFYRNHAQFHIARAPRPVIGFLGVKGREVVPIEACYIMHPLLGEVFADLDIAFPALERVSLRAGVNTGERMVILETAADAPPALEVDLPLSCVLLLADGTPVTLVGNSYITEGLRDRKFRISANSLFQVNTTQAEKLVEVVRGYLSPTGDEVILDAYCGVGTFGLIVADEVRSVIGVEENQSAMADANFNAGELDNVTLIEGRVKDVLPHLDEPIDAAILDPPRQGCERGALEALVKLRPHKIVYVSCDPATLARDAKRLGESGYELVEVQPLDMFPQTYHIECVALLRSR